MSQRPFGPLFGLLGASVIGLAASAQAQDRPPFGAQVDGLFVFQGDSDLSEGGEFSSNRTFLRAVTAYNFDNGASLGLSVSYGQFDYEFSDASTQPWTDIRDIRISIPARFRVGDRATAFVSPQIRWDYQREADADDGQTYGAFAGIAWEVSDSLTIGPGLGVFSTIGDNGTDVFPALLVDWDINDRWNLSTGTGLGATQGPGLTLGYAATDELSFGLTARYENIRFRLDDEGLAPDGIGEDRSIPVVLSLDYTPNPGVSLSVFAGAEFDGQLTLEDSSGAEISQQDYETAPIAGFAFRFRF
ncbi:MAG: hypothetical protein AAGF79_14085 [Pseudomonadota bacterium]